MTYGIRITNPIGELVLSSDTYFPVYLGMATFVSTTQAVGTGSASTGTGTGGFSTLTFNYAGQIVPVLGLPPGFRGAINQVTLSGSTWTIKVSYTDGSQNSDLSSPAFGMHIQAAPTVYVFGFPTALGGTYGLAIYNASGVLVGDLTRQPLVIRQRVALPENVITGTVTPLTLPGIAGRATDTELTSVVTGVPDIYRVLARNTIFGISGTAINRYWDRRKLKNSAEPEGVFRLDALTLWLVECSGL